MSEWWFFDERLECLMEAAIRLPREQRIPFLEKHLAEEPDTLQRARALLNVQEKADLYFQKPLLNLLTESAVSEEEQLSKDLESLEDYRLIKPIGAGGMGRVYLAEQVKPIKRTVALKVMKVHPLDTEISRYFEEEMHALAQMEHQHIARFYEAGTTRSGYSFFTMEWVQGVSLKLFLEKHELTWLEKCRLFQQICKGVMHAHQKGLIHRDLKPSNILVVGNSENASVKIIDFGIAKFTQPLNQQTKESRASKGLMRGTIAYMSPEQMRGEPLDVRVDVYGLGAILYEILTKRPVYQVSAKSGTNSAFQSWERMLQKNPALPSGFLEEKEWFKTSKKPRLGYWRSKDLDAVVMKALAKKQADRYPTVSHLSEDLQRLVQMEPVQARKYSKSHATYLWLVRHALLAATISTVMLAMVLGFASVSWSLIKTEQARIYAETRREKEQIAKAEAEALMQTWESLFRELYFGGLPIDTPFSEVLSQIEKRATDLPEKSTHLGRFYLHLGEAFMATSIIEKALHYYQKAIPELERTHTYQDPKVLTAKNGLAWANTLNGRYEQAKLGFRDVVEASCAPIESARAHQGLGDIYNRGKLYSQAENHYLQSLEIFLSQSSSEPANMFFSLRGLAIALTGLGDPRALDLFQALWDMQVATLGSDHLETLDLLHVWGAAYGRLQHLDQGLEMCRHAFFWLQDIYGVSHRKTLDALENWASLEWSKGNYQQVLELAEILWRRRHHTSGLKNPSTLAAGTLFASALAQVGRLKESIVLLEQVLLEQKELLGAQHPDALISTNNLANRYLAIGDLSKAEVMLSQTLTAQEELLGTHHLDTLITQCSLGETLLAQRCLPQALMILEDLNEKANYLPEASLYKQWFRYFLGITLAKLQRFPEAEPYLIASFHSLEHYPKVKKAIQAFYENWGQEDLALEFAQ